MPFIKVRRCEVVKHVVCLINWIDWTNETLYIFSMLSCVFYLHRARLRNQINLDKHRIEWLTQTAVQFQFTPTLQCQLNNCESEQTKYLRLWLALWLSCFAILGVRQQTADSRPTIGFHLEFTLHRLAKLAALILANSLIHKLIRK